MEIDENHTFLILRWSDLGSFGDTLHDIGNLQTWMTILGIFMAHFALFFMNWWGGAPIEPIPPEQTSPSYRQWRNDWAKKGI